MISFCNKEFFILYEENLNRTQLISHFCKTGHSTDIIAVYNQNKQFLGIITYERLLRHNDNLIQDCYLIAGSDIFDQAYELFQKDEHITYIPVFNQEMLLISFCYHSHLTSEKIYTNIINDLNHNNQLLFIHELYPKIKAAVIYNLNDLAYRFYRLLLNRGIPAFVVGSDWKDILDIDYEEITYSRYERMEIYSEGTPLITQEKDVYDKNRFCTPDGWYFLKDIAIANRIMIENLYKKEALAENRKLFICRLPMFEELSKRTMDEYYRNQNYVCLRNEQLDLRNELIQEQLSKIYNMNFEAVMKRFDFDCELKRVKKFAYGTNVRHYGTGENIIYVIGPCIVEGYYLFEEDELLYHLWEMVSRYFGVDYSIVSISIAELQINGLIHTMNSLSLSENDLLMFIGQSYQQLCRDYRIEDSVDMNLLELFDHRPQDETWFMDSPVHTTGTANKAISEHLFQELIKPEIMKILIAQRDIA